MKYDYHSAVKNDVAEYIRDNIKHYDFIDIDDLATQLEEDLWVCDSVTGNASGSYTFNAWKAEEYIAHNWGLLKEAVWEFGCDTENILDKGAEWCDVTIRCYLLNTAIYEVLEEMKPLCGALLGPDAAE